MEMSPVITMVLSFGLVGVAGLAVLEKFIPVVPSYVLLMFLGMTAGSASGLAALVAATAFGSMIGSLAWYGLGRALGSRRVEALVTRYGRFILLPPSLYQRLAATYRRNQFWATVVGHTIPTVRVYLGLPAGVFGLDPRGFALASLIGSLIWNAPFLGLGFLVQGSGRDPISLGLVVAAALIGAEFAILWLVRRVRRGGARSAKPLDRADQRDEATKNRSKNLTPPGSCKADAIEGPESRRRLLPN